MRTYLDKADIFSPAFTLNNKSLTAKAETAVAGLALTENIEIPEDLKSGADYGIKVELSDGFAVLLESAPDASYIGGFHVGLDGAIVPSSIWDANLRPACPDPRGMVHVPSVGWVDIYLLNPDPQIHGTSAAGKEIADGTTKVTMPDGSKAPLTWWNAVTVLAAHGKQLLSLAEFSVAAQGVEEGKTCGTEPTLTAHVPGLKSVHGLEQATGCMWTWGRDVEPSTPYVAAFGGRWGSDRSGARRCVVSVPDFFWYSLGARGRCDRLILG